MRMILLCSSAAPDITGRYCATSFYVSVYSTFFGLEPQRLYNVFRN